jgi:O-antigen ligase
VHPIRTLARWLTVPRSSLAASLLLGYLLLLPLEPLFNVVTVVLALLGLICLATDFRAMMARPGVVLFAALFACVWLPMLISLPDAVNVPESARKTGSFLLYLAGGVYVVAALARDDAVRWVVAGGGVIVTLWSVDAAWQFATGADFLGFPYDRGRLAGVFYPKLTLGIALVSFAPLFFEALRRAARNHSWVALALIPFVLSIALAGSRSAWLALGVAVAGYALYLLRWSDYPAIRVGWIMRALALLLCLGAGVALLMPQATSRAGELLGARVERLSGLFSGDRERMDVALSRRLSIWETGVRMYRAHWFNGVGPRGFRDAYAEHAGADDHFMARSKAWAPTHPHQLVLEIAAETGTVGLLGYLVFALLFLRALGKLDAAGLAQAFPFALGLIVVMFPFNAHKGFYGNFAASVVWWVAPLAIAALARAAREPDRD